MGRELVIARLYGRHVLGEEFHLLPHTAANDDVVAVETRRPPFPIENLVADVILDQAFQLLRGRRPPPRTGEPVRQRGDARRRNDDLRGGLGILLADQAEETEQGRPEHEEMQQRLPQERSIQGVYQIGEV